MAHCSVLESHQKPTDRPSKRIKRSGGHSLVNRGLAIWLIENVLLIMRCQKTLSIVGSEKIAQNVTRAVDNSPSQSPRMGKLKWEPPKHKRQFKAHPWIGIA